MNDSLAFLKEKSKNLPLLPGVYLMKDKKGEIIYVGKAKQLRSRVSSYFAVLDEWNIKTIKLVEKIIDFDYIVTLSELDALVLESSLIKLHSPKYNILLKDAKGFNYIKITSGDYPRLSYTISAADKSCEYIGPYTAGFSIRQSVDDANRIFMLPSCSRRFPEEFARWRPCLNYQIKLCIGVCLGGITSEEYKQRVKSAIDYIKKGSKESVRRLTNEMSSAAEALDFEKAARIRDQLAAIKRSESVQSVQSSKTSNYDIIASSRNSGVAVVAVVKYSGGRLVDKECFYLGDEYDLSKMLGDFMLEYYSAEIVGGSPAEIYLETEFEDKELFEEYLSGKFGSKVKIIIPKRGEGLAQMMMARNNADEYLTLKIGRKSKEINALQELAELLNLVQPPEYIECYDISNIGDMVKVGGLVVYRNGKPYKKGYRRFIIKEVEGLDDYACMREVVRRRFSRLQAQKNENADYHPDLILVDGGAGHVSAVGSVLEELGVQIPLFGLVKDSKHKTRAIASLGDEIQINAKKSVFTLLTKIQDEAHRFAVTFAREKHKKTSFSLTLTEVPGIGEKKAEALLKHFKTKQVLKSATVEQLRETAKISSEKAEELKKFINGNM